MISGAYIPLMADLEHDPVLFGVNRTPGIVAVEFLAPNRVQVYRRIEGETLVEETTHQPFVWATKPLSDRAREQNGNGAFRYVVSFDSAAAFFAAVKGHRNDIWALKDLSHQYLLASGRTLFKDMNFSDLRRMQVDIETFTPSEREMSNASRHPLLAIAMADASGWEKVLVVENPSNPDEERVVLEKFVALVQERNPDVIEGHNIFNFDLPYLETRAKILRVPLVLGRDGSTPRSHLSKLQFAERKIQYRKFEIHGRHIADMLHLVQLHDIGSRDMESYGLKAAARYFGVEESERVVLAAQEITQNHAENRACFERYALQDVRETRAISKILSPPWFIQTSIFPYNYQDVLVLGNATCINSLFLREYLRRGQSFPSPPPSRHFEGGATDTYHFGVAHNVWHCDVASLYPSVMLSFGLFPKCDTLNLFSGMLAQLRTFRLKAKSKMRIAAEDEKPLLNALQGTFKILINSFYGYLGFGLANFADFDTAEAVTAKGREILHGMCSWLQQRGAQVIEMDTDGIYFVPPAGVTWDELSKELAATLPQGIEVDFDACYAAMFSYKTKNYALLGTDGKLTIKGAALKSRGLEKFQRLFIETAIRALLEGRSEAVTSLYKEYATALRDYRWAPDMFAKTETLNDSPEAYRKKITSSKRNRAAAYELALRSSRKMNAGDRVSYYITGQTKNVRIFENAKLLEDWCPENRDENIPYYLAKLDALAETFEKFIPRNAETGWLL